MQSCVQGGRTSGFLSSMLIFVVVMSLGYSLLLGLVYVGCMAQHLWEGRTKEVVNDRDENCKPFIFRKAGDGTDCVYPVCLKKISRENFAKQLFTLPMKCVGVNVGTSCQNFTFRVLTAKLVGCFRLTVTQRR